MVEVVSTITLYTAKQVLLEAGFDWDDPKRQQVGLSTLRRGRIGDPYTGTAPWLEKGKHWTLIGDQTLYTEEGKTVILQRLKKMRRRKKPDADTQED
ncbi:MAG: hypothetical protein JNJ94_12700 [Chlorobi bacterium]|nr:hypothetical protein [Chlorobiota bacterium]